MLARVGLWFLTKNDAPADSATTLSAAAASLDVSSAALVVRRNGPSSGIANQKARKDAECRPHQKSAFSSKAPVAVRAKGKPCSLNSQLAPVNNLIVTSSLCDGRPDTPLVVFVIPQQKLQVRGERPTRYSTRATPTEPSLVHPDRLPDALGHLTREKSQKIRSLPSWTQSQRV